MWIIKGLVLLSFVWKQIKPYHDDCPDEECDSLKLHGRKLHCGKICRSKGKIFDGDIFWSAELGLSSNILFRGVCVQLDRQLYYLNSIFSSVYLAHRSFFSGELLLQCVQSENVSIWLIVCKKSLSRFAIKILQLCFIEKLAFCSIKNFVYPLSVHRRLESYNYFDWLKKKQIQTHFFYVQDPSSRMTLQFRI